ncbi:MAG TPA: ATP-binding cassette domain-containing protein [Rhodocyclaceae bacterium]
MITLRSLTFARAGEKLVDSASLQVHAGHKVGLVGANGCGKSTFLALLTDAHHAESGDLELPPGWTIAHVAQETEALDRGALDYALDGDAELRRVEAELEAAELANDGHALGSLHARFDEIGGYASRARAAGILHGLGFGEADLARPLAEFSGGWRMRLHLARALVCRSDLLLLDEPTNHLDLDAVLWLEGWLARYPGTLLMVSHDRDFLDRVCTHVIHIAERQMTLYRGNYSAFERTRAERLKVQQSLYERQQREVAHLQRFIDRFRAKATKARQAQSRIKALARLSEVLPAHADSPFHFEFPEPTAMPDPLLALRDAAVGYDGRAILDGISFDLRPGDRIGLLGRNGAGKTTLVKLLAGQLAPLAGSRHEGKDLAIGYFAQHCVEALRPEESALWHMSRLDPKAREQDLRNFLGGFDFHGEMATRPVAPFSGGEKARLALALIVRARPALLLLDEPTNHLDLEMRESLTVALQEFEGTIVLVSHDRHLLRATADSFLLVAGGRATPFDGDLDDYANWLDADRRAAREPPAASAAAPPARADRELEKADRQALLTRRRPLAKEIARLEAKLASWQGELKLLEQRLADPALYASNDPALLQTLNRRQSELTTAIDDAETRWLDASEALAALPEPDA